MFSVLRRCLVAAGLILGTLVAAPPMPAQAALIATPAPAPLVQTVQYYGGPRGYYRGGPRFYRRPFVGRPYAGRGFYGPGPRFYGRPAYARPYGYRPYYR